MNLRLLQLGDSALPIGGYSHSWGLEAAVERGLVRDAATLESWARHWLRASVAPSEGVVMAASCRAARAGDWAEVCRGNELLWCSMAPPSLRHASRDMGQQLVALAQQWPWSAPVLTELSRALAPHPAPLEWHHAAAFAILATAAEAEPEEALAVYLHQAALGAIGAGVRAIPIGHTHGQQVLARLHDEIAALARAFAPRGLDRAGSFCPHHEMLCHAQGHLYTRLFRS